MRVLRSPVHVVVCLSLALVVALFTTGAHAIEGEDPPDPLPAPVELAPADAGPVTGDADENAPAENAPPARPPAAGTSSDAAPSGADATAPPPSTTDTPPAGDANAEPEAPSTDAPSTDAPSTVAPTKRRLLDAPAEKIPAPVETPIAPVETATEAEASATTTPWMSATGWMALGVIAGMVPVALGVAALATGVIGFAWTAATPVGAANAAIPFALVGLGLLGGVGLAGPVGSALVAAVAAGSAWSSYDTETAMDVLFGGAPGFFLAGLSLSGLPCACLAGGLSMVYIGAALLQPTALLSAIGLALLSAGIGGAAMGSACVAPVVTGVGAWSSRRAIDNEKDRQREELREERKRGSRAMLY